MPEFDVRIQVETEGDDSVVGFVGMIASKGFTPEKRPRVGLDFRPWTYASITLRISAENPLVALNEGVQSFLAAFEMFDRDPPGGEVEASVGPPEPDDPSDPGD